MSDRRAVLARNARSSRLVVLSLVLGIVAAPALGAGHEATGSSQHDDATADDPAKVEANRKDVSNLKKQMGVLAEEIDAFKKALAVPEDGALKSQYGLGPAASKIYGKDKGLALGGYGEVRLRTFVGDDEGKTAIADALRAIVYVGYKFSDRVLVNSELEFEHAGTGGGGSVSTEFLNLDLLLHDAVNIRAGLLLVPMGFINEIHEPVFFFGNERPEVERQIIPSTWRENGAGLFGAIGDRVQYRAYVVNGFNGSGFSSSGLRGGRQKGSEALADDVAFVARVDVEPVGGLMLGGSVYVGNSGQNLTNSVCTDVTARCNPGPGDRVFIPTTETRELPSALTVVYELHAQYRAHGWSLRGLFTDAYVHDAGALSTALGSGASKGVAERMVGAYAEVGYDILPFFLSDTDMTLEPFFRYEYLNTQFNVPDGFSADASKDLDIYEVGVSFKPHSQVVLKLDYRRFEPGAGTRADEVQVGFGYVF